MSILGAVQFACATRSGLHLETVKGASMMCNKKMYTGFSKGDKCPPAHLTESLMEVHVLPLMDNIITLHYATLQHAPFSP